MHVQVHVRRDTIARRHRPVKHKKHVAVVNTVPQGQKHRQIVKIFLAVAMVPVPPHHARIRVRIIRPVRRGPIHRMTVPVMRGPAVMQERVRVRCVHPDMPRPVQVTAAVLHVQVQHIRMEQVKRHVNHAQPQRNMHRV